jgi:nitroreductase
LEPAVTKVNDIVNPTLDLLLKRRSVPPRDLLEPGPSPGQLEQILTAAARVPDHGKLVPWRFIVFEGEARQRLAAEVSRVRAATRPDPEKDAIERDRLTTPPLTIAVVSAAREHPKIPVWEQQLSAGAVCMNLVVAANALGFGAVWLTEWYGYDADVLAGIGLKPGERLAGFIHVGTARAIPEDRVRPVLSQIVARF